MKKIFACTFVAIILFACNNSGTTNAVKDTTGNTTTAPIDNVNGNVPDTSVNKNSLVDSSKMKDSMKKH